MLRVCRAYWRTRKQCQITCQLIDDRRDDSTFSMTSVLLTDEFITNFADVQLLSTRCWRGELREYDQ